MAAEIRGVLIIIKKNTSKENIPKRLRRRIRNINNGYRRVKVLVRPRKY